MSFGESNGLPSAQNGVGDPCVLVDETTNTIWIAAAWCHGMGGQRAWFSSMPGLDKDQTAQLMLVKSEDDGKTWSEPIDITSQVKDPSWHFLLQGPGRGITMQDGTLVFPAQFIDADRIPHSCIIYSKDHGKHWQLHNGARTKTTESQVAEIEPGVLMLNMIDKLFIYLEIEHRTKHIIFRNQLIHFLVGEVAVIRKRHIILAFQFRESLAEHIVCN